MTTILQLFYIAKYFFLNHDWHQLICLQISITQYRRYVRIPIRRLYLAKPIFSNVFKSRITKTRYRTLAIGDSVGVSCPGRMLFTLNLTESTHLLSSAAYEYIILTSNGSYLNIKVHYETFACKKSVI